jgi:GNAT superfamily N-acetyltransferase
MIQLVRVQEALPDGFDALRAEAAAEGFRHMDRLADEWAAGGGAFIALLAAFDDGELAGIGGLTREPAPCPESALRLRRLYVRPSARRRGVGRALASALIQEAFDQVGLVTVHAGGGSAPDFWSAQGMSPVSGQAWSHILRR